MFYRKIFLTTIESTNPTTFCLDMMGNALAHLKNKFENKCYKGCFVVQIIEITKISECGITRNNNSCNGIINVEFMAKVAVIGRWDIINGVEIIRKDQLIIGRYKRDGVSSAVSLMPTTGTDLIRVGQFVSIRVIQCSYPLFQPGCTMKGMMLTCDRDSIVYVLNGKLTPSIVQEMEGIIDLVYKELEARASMNYDDIAFFENLLYSYTISDMTKQDIETANRPTWSGPHDVQRVVSGGANLAQTNLFEIIDQVAKTKKSIDVTGLWSRDVSLFKSSPVALKMTIDPKTIDISKLITAETLVGENIPNSWKNVSSETILIAFTSMIRSTYDYLVAVRELVELYPDADTRASSANIWMFMKKSKRTD